MFPTTGMVNTHTAIPERVEKELRENEIETIELVARWIVLNHERVEYTNTEFSQVVSYGEGGVHRKCYNWLTPCPTTAPGRYLDLRTLVVAAAVVPPFNISNSRARVTLAFCFNRIIGYLFKASTTTVFRNLCPGPLSERVAANKLWTDFFLHPFHNSRLILFNSHYLALGDFEGRTKINIGIRFPVFPFNVIKTILKLLFATVIYVTLTSN